MAAHVGKYMKSDIVSVSVNVGVDYCQIASEEKQLENSRRHRCYSCCRSALQQPRSLSGSQHI